MSSTETCDMCNCYCCNLTSLMNIDQNSPIYCKYATIDSTIVRYYLKITDINSYLLLYFHHHHHHRHHHWLDSPLCCLLYTSRCV